ncbi:MAG: AarF/ABC1/UbiB kinase family protein [Pseudomonadota bacterium]
MNDETPFGRAVPVPARRLARLSRIGSMAAGVAGNMALSGVVSYSKGQRPSMRDLLLKPSNVERIADELARMRGAAMKLGQLISMDTGEVLPPELSRIMARLRAQADFMPPAQLKQVLAAEWPQGWLQEFAHFDVRPIAAASIGQVHRAKLKDGRDVAVKVQYPGVAKSIDSDVANVAALIRISGLLPKGFEIDDYVEEARKQLHEETDYAAEAEHLQRFRALLDGDARYGLPDFHADWSTRNILTMTYLPSRDIEGAVALDQVARDRMASDLVDLMLRELFEFRLMQTDPNFANYRFDPDTEQLILLDFGATRHLGETLVAQYRRLMRAGLSHDRAALREAAIEIGFFLESTETRHAERILDMMELVFGAITRSPLYAFGDPELSRAMNREGEALSRDGFIPPPLPIDVLFLQRKFAGIFLLAAKLQAHVPVAELLERHLAEPQ